MPKDMLITKLTKRLCNNLALNKYSAEWAVETWALALGIITCSDIKREKIQKPKRDIIHPKKRFTWGELTWEGNSKLMFDKIVSSAPKFFRVMAENKLRENICRKVEILGKVTENTIIECIKEITPKSFIAATIKSVEPLRTTTSNLKLVRKHSSQKNAMKITEAMKKIREKSRLFLTDFKRNFHL
jgi:hypothetical protein